MGLAVIYPNNGGALSTCDSITRFLPVPIRFPVFSCLIDSVFGIHPLAIMQRLPIGKGDTPVNLGPGRDKRLPTIYQTKKHPKYKGPGHIFYFIQDLKKSALKQIAILEKSLKIPHGTHQDAIDKGMAFMLALCHRKLTHNRRVSPPA